jgi:hypothetical protein
MEEASLSSLKLLASSMAERARFELARDVNPYPLSRRAPSTAQPSLRNWRLKAGSWKLDSHSCRSPRFPKQNNYNGLPCHCQLSIVDCRFLLSRRSRKNSCRTTPHSSANTPVITSIRWFRRGSWTRLKRLPAAPALGSAAP